MPEHRLHALNLPVLMLALANATLFAAGAALHAGVPLGPIEEPTAVSVATLETVAAVLFLIASLGMLAGAPWQRAIARFSNLFAIVAVAAVAMLLALDGERSAAPVKSMQVLRVVFASVSLLMLYHSGRERLTR